MPKIESDLQNAKEMESLYPQRAFEYVDRVVDNIQKIESGEMQKIELTDTERENLSSFEKSLCSEFEKMYKISVNSTTLYLDYFAAKEGKKSFQEKTGLEIKSDDPYSIKQFILSNSDRLVALSSTERTKLAGETLSFKDKLILDGIMETADTEGNISIENIPVPERIEILINPDKANEKIKGLRSLKKELKEKYKDIDDLATDSLTLKAAKKEILDIYRRRLNIWIMDLFPYALLVEKKRQIAGEQTLSAEEKEFFNFFEGLSDPEKNRSRLDKLIYGASKEYDEDGWKVQTPESLLPHVERIASLGEEAEMHKKEMMRSKGLDPEKILSERIDVETRADLGEEILASYNLLSNEPRKNYDPERKGKAEDSKWQIVNLPNRSTFGVIESKGVILGPEKRPYGVADTFETLGHEIEGHVLQNENKKLVDLEYFQKFGKDSRAVILSEGGAMFVQDVISREAFGYPTVPHPHYIRAMQKKLEGRNYLDCIKFFYDSRMNAVRKKKEEGRLDSQAFKKEIADALETAINRSERLFGTGASLSSREKYLTHSKDTAYLEQYILSEKLKEAGLEKLLFFGAGNLQDVLTLLKLNLLDLNKVRTPKYQTLKLWEREKDKYMLKSE